MKWLSLTWTMNLLKSSDGKSSCQLTAVCGVGRIKVTNILKVMWILDLFDKNRLTSCKCQCVTSTNHYLNDSICGWNISVSQALMQQKALIITKGLSLSKFKTSVGWMETFKTSCLLWSTFFCPKGDHRTDVVIYLYI